MKSPMVTNLECITDKAGYSDLQVLKSGGGFYVGTLYTGPGGFEEPGSRDSHYFKTREEAERYLKDLTGIRDAYAASFLRKRP